MGQGNWVFLRGQSSLPQTYFDPEPSSSSSFSSSLHTLKNVTSLATNGSKGHRNSTRQTWLTELRGRGKGASVTHVARWALFCYRFLLEGKALHNQAKTGCELSCSARQLASCDDCQPATVSAGGGVIIYRVQTVILEFKLTPGLRRWWTPAYSAPGFCWPQTQVLSSSYLKFKTQIRQNRWKSYFQHWWTTKPTVKLNGQIYIAYAYATPVPYCHLLLHP